MARESHVETEAPPVRAAPDRTRAPQGLQLRNGLPVVKPFRLILISTLREQ